MRHIPSRHGGEHARDDEHVHGRVDGCAEDPIGEHVRDDEHVHGRVDGCAEDPIGEHARDDEHVHGRVDGCAENPIMLVLSLESDTQIPTRDIRMSRKRKTKKK